MLRLILLIVIIILVLSFFGISLENLFHAPTTTSNFDFVWQLVVSGWNSVVQFIQGVLSSVGVHTT